MNEAKLLNIGGQDYNIKDEYARNVIGPSEDNTSSSTNLPVASRDYAVGAYLIGQNRLYYKVIAPISIGDTLVVGTNIEATSVSDEIEKLAKSSSDAIFEYIADLENTSVAKKAHADGSYICWTYGNTPGLYKVTSAIRQYDTISAGNNVEYVEDVTSQVSKLFNIFNKTTNYIGPKNLLPIDTCLKVSNGIFLKYFNHEKFYRLVGTATGDAFILFHKGGSGTNGMKLDLKPGRYIFSTELTYSENYHTFFILFDSSGTSITTVYYGGTVDIPSNAVYYMYGVFVKSGTTCDSIPIKPMLRLAEIEDATYEPYANSNDKISGSLDMVVNELGAKNLQPIECTNQVISGVNFVVNGDGTIHVWGTSTEQVVYTIGNSPTWRGVTMSAAPEGSGDSTYGFCFYDDNTGTWHDYTSETDKTVCDFIGIKDKLTIVVRQGVTLDKVFKPMVRLSSITDGTYAPYAKTNRELTLDKVEVSYYNNLVLDVNNKAYKADIVNPNILDNPWFLVNQRGYGEYSTSGEICVDRWHRGTYNESSGHDIYIGGVRLPYHYGDLYQVLDASESGKWRAGKTMTVSANIDGGIYSYTFTPSATSGETISHIGHMNYDGLLFNIIENWGATDRFLVGINNTSSTSAHIIWNTKLELGSMSTLNTDQIEPNRLEQISRCQRYFVRFGGINSVAAYSYNLGLGKKVIDDKTVYITIPLPVAMRGLNFVNLVGSWGTNGEVMSLIDYSLMPGSMNLLRLALKAQNNISGDTFFIENIASGVTYLDVFGYEL